MDTTLAWFLFVLGIGAIYFGMGVVATTIFKQLEKISTQLNRIIELMVERSEKTVK